MERRTSSIGRCEVADHLRAITFLMADGVLLPNEGRGYVFAQDTAGCAPWTAAGHLEPFLHELTAAVVDQMAGVYSEVRSAAATITEATRGEEERFIATLDQVWRF
jgi:alanyl-tRNA synthetase